MSTPPVVLTVAGTDSGGAAGVAADLATFAALGTHGACVVTAVTAQDTTGVQAVHAIPVDVIDAQLDAVFDDLPVAAVKTGMLGSPEAVHAVAERFGTADAPPLVVDPVLVATSGAVLGDVAVVRAYREVLLPVATVITPNPDEARCLVGTDGPPQELAALLAGCGPAVVVTGGPGGFETVAERPPPRATEGTCTDWLARPGQEPVPCTHPAVRTSNDHGTGCTYSAALAAVLARGAGLEEAVGRAAAYTTRQLRRSSTWSLGRGRGPIAHLDPTTEGDTV